MTALAIIGFVVLCFAAAYMTAAAVITLVGESVFGGITIFTWVFCAIAVGLWSLAWWLSPFTVSFGVSA